MRKLVLMIMAIGLVSTFSVFAGEKKKPKYTPEEYKKMVIQKVENQGMIGVDGKWDKEKKGLIIKSFFEGSNAEKAGLQKGDILTKINGIAMDDKKGASADCDNRAPGKTVSVTVDRNGKEMTMNVELIPYPEKLIQMKVEKYVKKQQSKEMKIEKAKKKKYKHTPEEYRKMVIQKVEKHGMIGVEGDWSKEKKGLIIKDFLETSNAEKAGLQKGDILMKINGIPMDDKKGATADCDNRTPGKTAAVTVDRDGKEMTMNVELIPYPKDLIEKKIKKYTQAYHNYEMKMQKKKQMMKEKKEMKEKTE